MKKKIALFTIVISSYFLGCTSKNEVKQTMATSKTLGIIIKDSMASYTATLITKANPPKYVKAAPPTIVPLSYPFGVGIPHISNYGSVEGLPGSWIKGSAIDREGNIWFASSSGISKYDGSSFTNYSADNGMSLNSVFSLMIDSKNNIWIAGDDGIKIFNGKNFNNLTIGEKNALKKFFVVNMFEDNKGTIWLSTGQGLFKYEDDVFTSYTTADGLADMTVWNVIQDKHNDILITTQKGVTRFDGKTFTPYLTIPANINGEPPRLRYCDSKGNIWFSDALGGLGIYDGKQIKIYTEKDGFNNRYGGASGMSPNFLEDKKGNYWIGGANGVTKFDGQRFINYGEKEGLTSLNVVSMLEDAYGNIWAGTRDNGFSKISNADLLKLEILSPFIIDMKEDNSGNLWVSTREGIGKYYSDHIAFYGKEILLNEYAVLFIDQANHVWFSVQRNPDKRVPNLIRFDGTGYTIFGKDQGLTLDYIKNIEEDDANNLWLLGINEVVKFDGASFTKFGPAKGLKSNCVYQDSKKNIWYGSNDAGVYRYDGKHFTNYTIDDGLPNGVVRNISEDGLGNIWFATSGGAGKFDGHNFFIYKAKDGLDNNIGDVEYDSVNKLIWFTTDLGLASLSMDQANEEKPFFQHYNPRTGFDISSIYDFVIDKQGVIWGRDGRVFRFDYKGISNSKPIPLEIRNIRLDNENISWNTLRKDGYPDSASDSLAAINEMGLKFGKSFTEQDFQKMSDAFGKVSYDSVKGSHFIPVNLVLPFENNTISFEFGSISTSFGKAIQYQYKLEGYDKSWSTLSSKTEANFGNMGEGNYTFHVKAVSPFGTWSEASYSFRVLPPWYRTLWAYALYVILFVSGAGLFIRWRTKALQKEKALLEEKVTVRTAELNQSLENLKATQSQLIQSEKMASLGELTAGIAHEIQNPLNFVNNFSELNKELVQEAKSELTKGDIEEAKEILNDIESNSEKINHHGNRAADIVKGMLQHSSSSSGKKEPTNINALADEYLRLAYHGLRAKDKSFNATMTTDFDESIGKINIIPQDIGRVILNLITNAFYVVNEKSKLGIADYEPTVSVTTKMVNDKVEIKVADNGNGIPEKILDKIFQPFFTTKPTGQGIGLGLSLSYDIVKAHGGEIKVETKEGEGSEFIIFLPN